MSGTEINGLLIINNSCSRPLQTIWFWSFKSSRSTQRPRLKNKVKIFFFLIINPNKIHPISSIDNARSIIKMFLETLQFWLCAGVKQLCNTGHYNRVCVCARASTRERGGGFKNSASVKAVCIWLCCLQVLLKHKKNKQKKLQVWSK